MAAGALCALALAPAACGSNERAPPAPQLSFLTFNVLHGIRNEDPEAEPFDRFPERLPRIADELARRRPTAILLQETLQVHQPRYPDVAATLDAALNAGLGAEDPGRYELVFGSSFGNVPTRGSAAGLGQMIWARAPITAIGNRSLQLEIFNPRTVVHARIETERGPVDAYDVHLAGFDDAPRAEAEYRAMLAFVDETAAAGGTALIGGDLNQTPEAPVNELLRDAGFVDLAERCGLACDPPDQRAGCTSGVDPLGEPGVRAGRRIDYLWLRSETPFRATCDPAFDEPFELPDGSVLWPSDHVGLEARITFLR
jgi:endonuclease/exonuclease/phosphatase family metal-dependent hydrolase